MDEVLAEFEKNPKEHIRLALSEYRGHLVIDLRIFYADADTQQWCPTRKGLSLSVERYPALKAALETLEGVLRERALLPAEVLDANPFFDL